MTFDAVDFASHSTNFIAAKFDAITIFEKCKFSGKVEFARAKFGSQKVSFETVRAWNDVSVDWDEDLALMPKGILPSDWPPKPPSLQS
jgi:hypothetical protein